MSRGPQNKLAPLHPWHNSLNRCVLGATFTCFNFKPSCKESSTTTTLHETSLQDSKTSNFKVAATPLRMLKYSSLEPILLNLPLGTATSAPVPTPFMKRYVCIPIHIQHTLKKCIVLCFMWKISPHVQRRSVFLKRTYLHLEDAQVSLGKFMHVLKTYS